MFIPTFLLIDMLWIEGFAWEIHIPSILFLLIGLYFILKQLTRYKQKPVPETFTLKTDTIECDSGVPVLQLKWPRTNGVDFGNRFYHNRINAEYQLSEIKSLKIRTQWQKQRLFITKNNKRREIGLDLSTYEREWLLDYIASRYDNN